ncbi:acetylornithine deacetylase [Mycobacterium sp. KBS0706]|uniref:acetylornithine deacetylase n=1 Tax=Mycobacterium sp. KBS0706 TaxID=2578109 RepID=UPI00110FAA20|nr:acetylornithine deacetylase [Mycobacterium sp. KBS0706]TSD88779.1 acetylornithine deacetylase [Mycobacterium sp. KBS0706]
MKSVEEILADLVAIPSVCRTPNGAIVDYALSYLAEHGVAAEVLPGPEGDRANLFATIGPADVPGTILSAHLDVVPAAPEGWTGHPFALRRDGDRLFGRGAVDMKGFVACVLASVPTLVEARLTRPVHIALSYDEEVGCVGVRHLIDRLPLLCAPPSGCIVGEPTGLRPVLRHKGKIAQRVRVRGRAGHSSRPDLADNAIHLAAELMLAVRDEARRIEAEGPFDDRFAPPVSTLQVGVVSGGTGVNIVPADCVFDLEARAIPGTDPAGLWRPIAGFAEDRVAALRAEGRSVAVDSETLALYPALDLADDHPLAALAEAIAQQPRQAAVSFGTEAGLYQQAGVPSIVCGPGAIDRAHKPDEFITRAELASGVAMLGRLVSHLSL